VVLSIGSVFLLFAAEARVQLLEYSFWPGAQEGNRLIIVGGNEIDAEGEKYFRRLRKKSSLPFEYQQVRV